MEYKRTTADYEYEEIKNGLIKHAVRHANELHGVRAIGNVEEFYRSWNTAFFGEMKKLARAEGLNAF